jgi:hypothetical protein
MEIRVGDLVRIRGEDWLQKPLGIVTEVKQLTHDESGTEYITVTALVGGKYFTFSDESFEVMSTTEREKS